MLLNFETVADFEGTWYEGYDSGGYSNTVIYRLKKSVIPI
jgi:hypothetical protein